MWMIFLFMLMVPFIPQQFLGFLNPQEWGMNPIHLASNPITNGKLFNPVTPSVLQGTKGLQDFALSVDRSTLTYLNQIGLSIWLIGMVVCAIMIMKCNYGIKSIKDSIRPIKNKAFEEVFEVCKCELHITRELIVGESTLVHTPMVFGLRKTYIVLPSKMIHQFSLEDMKYIFLHELIHYKNKDILMNYTMCVFQVIYWFNPLVYWVFRKMRTDREVACDMAVLKRLDKTCYIHYGRTIVNFAEIISQPGYFTIMSGMGGSKKQIKSRIEKIAYFKKETRLIKVKSLLIFIVIAGFVLSGAPAMSIMAYEYKEDRLQGKQVIYEDLAPYFKGMEGSFVLYDLQKDDYRIYNKDKSVKRVSPNSTYKIYSALIALENNVIKEEDSTLKWQGQIEPYEAWNQDQNLNTAIKNSVNWYFQTLDKTVGKEKLQYYFEKIGYGNHNLSGGIDSYWMESSLRLSPIEQVELMKDLYTNNMIFQPEHINFVKESLKISEKEGAVLSGKTGSGKIEGKGTSGWFVGFVEREGQAFIFATHIQDEDQVSGSLAAEMTLSILKDKNIY